MMPPGFLIGTRVLTDVFGTGEYVLRLIPFLASLALLAVGIGIGRQFMRRDARYLFWTLLAVSPYLVYYSAEVKPYQLDALVALLLVWLALRIAQGPPSPRAVVTLGAAILLALFFSLSSAFVSAGLGVVLLTHWALASENVRQKAAFLSLSVLALIVVVAGLGFVPRPQGYMLDFWRSGFMPAPPRSLADLAWFADTPIRVFRDPLGVMGDKNTEAGFYQAAAGLIAFVAGTAYLVHKRRTTAALMLAPIAVTLLASAMQRYPFGGTWTTGGRIILFLGPLFYFVMAEGAARLARAFRRDLRPLALLVPLLLLAPSIVQGAVNFLAPADRSAVKPILAALGEDAAPGDAIFVHYDVSDQYRYYSARYGLDSRPTIWGECSRFDVERYFDQLGRLRGMQRVWIVFGQGWGAFKYDERALMLRYLDHLGTRLDDWQANNASAYLYDLSGTPVPSTPFSFADPGFKPRIDQGCAMWGGV